mmetsp:Transcript_2905/g.5276  ORF Transcript_2905/g.5276 Transcript_2905/m.5276 type:complete len:82 (+) Transcript_2905:155-400(+)
MTRMMVVDSLMAGDKTEGGYLASLLAVAMGDFSGITVPLSAFMGDCCLFTLTIFLVTATCQNWYSNDSQLVNGTPILENEF